MYPSHPKRRKLTTAICVSSADRLDSEARNRERAIANKTRESQAKLFDSIYGKKEILSRVELLSGKATIYPPHSGPITPPIQLQPVPIAPLRYDRRVYGVGSDDEEVEAPRVSTVRKSAGKISPEEVLEAFRQKPFKRVVVPTAQGITSARRSIQAPSYAEMDSFRVNASPIARPKSIDSLQFATKMGRMQRGGDALKSYASMMSGAHDIVKSAIPLQMFDDEGYDDGLEFKIPCFAESLYSFNKETLEWRRCRVIEGNGLTFKIVWADEQTTAHEVAKPKDVHRISLRFEFDDEDAFDQRRSEAFSWRETVEGEMRLRALLSSQSSNQYGNQDPNMVMRIKEHVRMESPKLNMLLQDVAEEYMYGLKLAKYVADCKDCYKRQAFENKGYAIVDLTEMKVAAVRHLDIEKYADLVFPDSRMFSVVVGHLERITTRNLFGGAAGDCGLHELFENLGEHVERTLQIIHTQDIPEIEVSTRQVLLQWPIEEAKKLMTLIDYRYLSVIRGLMFEALRAFEEVFTNHRAYIRVEVSHGIGIEDPQIDETIAVGKRYLRSILSCCDGAQTMRRLIGLPGTLDIQLDALDAECTRVELVWEAEIRKSYSSLSTILQETKERVASVPLNKLDSFNDLFADNTDLVSMRLKLRKTRSEVESLVDELPPRRGVGWLAVSFGRLYNHLWRQCDGMREIVCENITNRILGLVDNVDDGIMDLKERCAKTPLLIEEWYDRHLLLINLKANFASINDGLDSTMELFDFLTDFNYETKFHISMAYRLKYELRQLLNNLPEAIEREKVDLERLKSEHEFRKNCLTKEISALFETLEEFHLKGELLQCEDYLTYLKQLEQQCKDLEVRVKKEQDRDTMARVEVREYPVMDDIRKDLALFIPVWRIICDFDMYTQRWMSVPFLELVCDDIIKTVKHWQTVLLDGKATFEGMPMFSVGTVVFEAGEHPLLVPFGVMEGNIDELISHIPIIQHMCNPVLRNRHWDLISKITGRVINQNEGLTWQWILESGIESLISEIAKISRNAISEYKIEKALSKMMDEVRTLSVTLKTEEGHTKIEDATEIFRVLSEHQVRIQEIFVPPHIKPFLMKIKEYDCLATNLRTILNRTLDAQSTLDDLAPAMESQSIKVQSQNMAINYEENVKVFNRLVTKFGDPSQFHDLISNPKYFSIVDDLQGNLKDLKEDLDRVMKEKREIFPQFRFLSDSQLIHLISHAEDPEKFATYFTYVYPTIERGLFNGMECIGFRSVDGEEVKFLDEFTVTPESVERIFENFDMALVSTLQSLTYELAKAGQVSNVERLVKRTPTQVACLVYQLIFNNRVEAIMSGADAIFSEKKSSVLHEGLDKLLVGIQKDVGYLSCIGKERPSAAVSNLVSTLIKQRDIVNEMIAEKASTMTSHSWMKHLRYWGAGDSASNYSVTVGCGLNVYPYGFCYTSGSPIPFLTEAREAIYSDFMASCSQSLNSMVIGPLHSFKTAFIASFAHAMGRNCFTYSCSSLNTVELLTSIITTISLTGYFLVLRDLHLLDKTVLADVAPQILVYSKKSVKASQRVAIYGTYEADSSAAVPTCIRLMFRPVMMRPPDTEIVVKTFLVGVGLGDRDDLYLKLVALADCLSVVAGERYSAVFSVRNLMRTIAERAVDQEDPARDIYQRLKEQVRDIGLDNEAITEKLGKILDITDTEEPSTEDVEIPKELLPSSDVVTRYLRQFLEMVPYHKDIIMLGSPLSGKSTIIDTAAKLLKRTVSSISPHAQGLEYLYSNKEKGLFFSAVNAADWIIFDGRMCNDWLDVLAVSMGSSRDIYFDDGTIMKIADNLRFVFETDSLEQATPSTLAFCAQLYIPSDAVTHKDQIAGFVAKLVVDERVVEPVSQRLIGTTIPLAKFEDEVRSFLEEILEYLMEHVAEIPLFTKVQCVENFLRVLESLLSVHFYSNGKIDVFNQYPLSEIFEHFRSLTLFAATWSFGAMTLGDKRKKFETVLRGFATSKELVVPEQSLFDFYYHIGKSGWRQWKEMKASSFFDTSAAMSDIIPEYVQVDPVSLVSTLYFTNMMISQGKNVLVDCQESKLDAVISHLSVNTEYMGAHFSQMVFRYPNAESETDKNPLRSMIDQCLAGIRDGSRSTSRLPLLVLMGVDMPYSRTTELLRFVLNNGYLLNLENFAPEVTTSLRFLIATKILSDTKKGPNFRLMRQFAILRVAPSDEQVIETTIVRSLETLCAVPHANEIGSIMYKHLGQFYCGRMFNFKHIMRIIQRVGMVMDQNSPGFFVSALGYESAAVIYDAVHSDDVLDVLETMVEEVAEVLDIQKLENVHDQVRGKILTNLSAVKFRAVRSINDIANEVKVVTKSPIKCRFGSLIALPKLKTSYVVNFNGLSVALSPSELPMDDQLLILKFTRMFTTPRTHVLVNTDVDMFTEQMVEKAVQIMGFDMSVFRTGQNVLKLIHDHYVKAGMLERHQIVFVNEQQLAEADLEIIQSMIEGADIFGLFAPNEMLMIMSEMYCKVYDDPFHEETLEAKANYHMLTRKFLRDCGNYFHICVTSSEASHSFGFFFQHCQTITVTKKLSSMVRYSSHFKIIEQRELDANRMTDVLLAIRDEQTEAGRVVKLMPFISGVTSFYSGMFDKHVTARGERMEILEKIWQISKKVDNTMTEGINAGMAMETKVQAMAKEMEDIMAKTKMASDKATGEKLELEREEKVLIAEQEQAERLRKESEESMTATKSILTQSVGELRKLSARDMSVIKTMNHPTKGVFLVLKSIVVVMGHKIEDKTDEVSPNQPSFVLGKKLLSDTSFVQNLMRRALEGTKEDVIAGLQPIIDDPNFEPETVAKSSTAAKGICQFIRAIMPYYTAQVVFDRKQQELKDIQVHVKELQKRHETAVDSLAKSNKEIEEADARLKRLQLDKLMVENRMEKHNGNVARQKLYAEVMKSFFDGWYDELVKMKAERDSIETDTYFMSCCLSLYGTFHVVERDGIFESISRVFESMGLPVVKSREAMINAILADLSISVDEFGKRSLHSLENIALFLIPPRRWYFVVDEDHLIRQVLKPIVSKRMVVTSYLGSDFANDLLNAVLGNDLLIVYDYPTDCNDPVLHQIYAARDKKDGVEIAGRQAEIPDDFQIVFVVSSFRSDSVFDGVFLEMSVTDEEITYEITRKLFNFLDPDSSQRAITTFKSASDSRTEIEKIKVELQGDIVANEDIILDSEFVYKRFFSASTIVGRLATQVERLNQIRGEIGDRFDAIAKIGARFVDMYRDHRPRDGICHFYDIIVDVLSSTEYDKDTDAKGDEIVHKFSQHLMMLSIQAVSFDERMRKVCASTPIELGEYSETIQSVVSVHGEDVVTRPATIPDIMELTDCRRPILVSGSRYLLNFLSNGDKIVLAAPTRCIDGFAEALRNGKGLVTICSAEKLSGQILSVISKIRSATSLSHTFRFFIFTDAPPNTIATESMLIDFCDILNLNGITSIRALMSFSMSSLPVSTFDSKFGKTAFWRRVVFLLGFYSAAANAMAQCLFQNAQFNEDNLGLMIAHCRDIEQPDFADMGPLFVSSMFCVERTQVKTNLLRLWNIVFNQEHLEDNQISLFETYTVPAKYAPEQVQPLISKFPLTDLPAAYGLPPNSDHHYRKFEELQWKDTRFGRRNLTIIELQMVNVKNVVWYLKYEAEEVNKRFIHRQHTFDRGLRLLLAKLRSLKPVVDLSLMFKPDCFFGLLKYRFHLETKCDPSRVVFVLTNEETDMRIENLIMTNAECEEDGKFAYLSGSRVLPQMFVKVAEIDPAMVRIVLYREGVEIGIFHVYAKNVLPADSVFLLTAFTTPLK